MKRILRYFIMMVTLLNCHSIYAEKETDTIAQIVTTIFDGERQPLIVGGIISNNISMSNITQKGVIIGTNQDEMKISKATTYDKDYTFTNEFSEKPCTLRFYDCNDLNERQFYLSLRILKSNTQYYVKAYVINKEGNVIYGNTETIKTLDFDRYEGRYDVANVWHAFSYTLFDLVTDEIIDPDKDGFYYSTNENPTRVAYQKGTSYNTCYKFATEWNYKLWYYHNVNHCDSTKIVSMPSMSYKDGKLTIIKDIADADKDISIYYSIDGNYFRPENYTDLYSEPIEVSKGHYVCCYAISTDGYMSYTNLYVVREDDDNSASINVIKDEHDPQKTVIYNLNGQRLQNVQKGINIINGKKVVIK